MLRTSFLFQQKLKLAIKDQAAARTFPVYILIWILSVSEVNLDKSRALDDNFLSLSKAILSPARGHNSSLILLILAQFAL